MFCKKVPLTDDEYTIREPHPHFTRHLECEQHVLRHADDLPNLRAVVLSSGVQYGDGEGLFEYMFRRAWMPQAAAVGIPVFGDGLNTIPTIHIADCCRMLEGLIIQATNTPVDATQYTANTPTALTYTPLAIACDAGSETLREIAQAISLAFTSDGVDMVYVLDPSEAYLFDELDQLEIDTLMANVNMETNTHADFTRYVAVRINRHVSRDTKRITQCATSGTTRGTVQ